MRSRIFLLLVFSTFLGAFPVFGVAAERTKLNWSAWEEIPVYHQGRVMPLDTFARMAVDIICDRTNPTLSLKGAVSEREFRLPTFAEARKLFPGDEPRRFEAAELLFSWLVEPRKWEDVPFLIAEHDVLRKKYLDVPLTNDEGTHLKYVSPRQVREADAFHERLAHLRDMQIDAQREGREIELDGVDAKVDALWRAFRLHQQLIFSTTLDPDARKHFASAMQRAAPMWFNLRDDLQQFTSLDQGNLATLFSNANGAIDSMAAMYEQPRIVLNDIEDAAVQFASATRDLADHFGALRRRLENNAPPGVDAEQAEKARGLMDRLAAATERIARDADKVLLSIYQNGEPLRVVPALNAPALESDRDTADLSQPWLDLQTLLTGKIEGLRDWPDGRIAYPQAEVKAVRLAFDRTRDVYFQREDRPNDFARYTSDLSLALRSLSEAIEPLRGELQIKRPDEDLLTYTAYPAPGYTGTERRYNHLDPFMWSWVISLGAVLCFSLNFGVLRRWMLWAGVIVLTFGLFWTAYGFYLRIVVTRWAPVTNMYETVVYVPFFVSMLGAWFLLLPVNWPGVKNAWRLTAIPALWEAAPLSSEQSGLMSVTAWNLSGWLIALGRAALMLLLFNVLAVAEYAAGGRHIINLAPVVDIGQSFPDLNDLMVWAVGMCLFIPALWFLPRVVLTAAASAVLIPWTLRRGEVPASKLIDEVYPRWPFGLAATFVAFFGAFVAWYSPVLDKEFSPLQPVLRDNFWLLIHVLTIVSSYGAGSLAWGLGNVALGYYLLGTYRDPATSAIKMSAGHQPAHGGAATAVAQFKRPPEECATLANYTYKAIQLAVLLLAVGTILGGLWADVAWGRFWGWDPKEVWALISCLVYLAVLHGRMAGLVGNFGLIAGSVIGASMIIMSWYGVNFVLGAGLHSYGFGAGGQGYVAAVVLANWWFLWFAGTRYMRATGQDSTSTTIWMAFTFVLLLATLTLILAYTVPSVGQRLAEMLAPAGA